MRSRLAEENQLIDRGCTKRCPAKGEKEPSRKGKGISGSIEEGSITHPMFSQVGKKKTAGNSPGVIRGESFHRLAGSSTRGSILVRGTPCLLL